MKVYMCDTHIYPCIVEKVAHHHRIYATAYGKQHRFFLMKKMIRMNEIKKFFDH